MTYYFSSGTFELYFFLWGGGRGGLLTWGVVCNLIWFLEETEGSWLPNGKCAVEWSEFQGWPVSLCCVQRDDTLFSQCVSYSIQVKK